jgi:hypothetical protein
MKKSPLSTRAGNEFIIQQSRGHNRGYRYNQMKNKNLPRFLIESNFTNQFEDDMISLYTSSPVFYNTESWKQSISRHNNSFSSTCLSSCYGHKRNGYQNNLESYHLPLKYQCNFQYPKHYQHVS